MAEISVGGRTPLQATDTYFTEKIPFYPTTKKYVNIISPYVTISIAIFIALSLLGGSVLYVLYGTHHLTAKGFSERLPKLVSTSDYIKNAIGTRLCPGGKLSWLLCKVFCYLNKIVKFDTANIDCNIRDDLSRIEESVDAVNPVSADKDSDSRNIKGLYTS
tara:strand:- start:65 stop:547 length:483 start_codon:yes stop_codon:yes gene_type:complete